MPSQPMDPPASLAKTQSNVQAEFGVVLIALVLPTLVTALYFVVLATAATPVQLLGYASKIIQFGLPIFWVVRVCRERGFWPHNGTRDGVVFGLVFGAFIAIATLALYLGWLKPSGYMDSAMDQIRAKVLGLGVNQPWKYFLLAAFYSLVHSLLEEYYWRWFVFGRLRRWVKMPLAILISSIGFMAHHVLVLGFLFGWTHPLTYFLSLSVAVGGAVWAALYHRTNNILGPWLSHLLVDAAIFAVGFEVIRSHLT